MANLLGRRSFRQIPGKGLVEIEPRLPRPKNDDLRFEDNFVSPIDGTIIRNKNELAEHNARNNVECTSDGHFQDWEKAQKKREDFFLNGNPAGKEERIEAIKHTIEKLGE